MDSLPKSLYPDFTLTTENCDIEPIHRPIAIQGQSAMLVFDEKTPDYLYGISENVPGLLGMDIQSLWQTPYQLWMMDIMKDVYEEMAHSSDWDPIDPFLVEFGTQELNVVRHKHNGKNFLEIEPALSNNVEPLSAFHSIRLVCEPLKSVNNLEALYQIFCQKYKKVSGYDRVMVYAFDKDFNGHVVGEAKEDKLESFLGLHYPSTDIPKIARDLFLLNRSRIIPDVKEPNHWLCFNPGLQGNIPYLDLTHSQSRATSPIHIEYLNNMGVCGTMTFALIIDNKLWGLVACHHYSPKFINYEMRKTGELIVANLAQRIVEITHYNYKQSIQDRKEKLASFLSLISTTLELGVQLISNKPDLRPLIQADGFALVVNHLGVYSYGEVPPQDLLLKLAAQRIEQKQFEVYSTQNVHENLPALTFPPEIGGMLCLGVESADEMILCWFRNSQASTFYWGGDPSVPYEVDFQANGEVRISPRKSFEKWKTQLNHASLNWVQADRDVARQIREQLLRKEVERKAAKAHSLQADFEQLTYAASHDLQEPLRTVRSYIDLLEEDLTEGRQDDIQLYLSRTGIAADRMQSLISDLLTYSRLGNLQNVSWVNVSEILQEITEDMSLIIGEKEAKIQASSLPAIRAVKVDIKQLFQNFISNALKYQQPDIPPNINISAEKIGINWVFAISDNGIGIEEQYFDNIFQLFARLHGHDEYPGTGIGLASCKKIVDNLNGRVWLTSVLNEGTTFYVSLHQSIIRPDES